MAYFKKKFAKEGEDYKYLAVNATSTDEQFIEFYKIRKEHPNSIFLPGTMLERLDNGQLQFGTLHLPRDWSMFINTTTGHTFTVNPKSIDELFKAVL